MYKYDELKRIGGKIIDKLVNVFIIGLLLLVVYFFFYNSVHVWVDNPTLNPIIVKVNSNGEEKEIPAKSKLQFSVNNGENEIFLNGKNVGIIDKEFFGFSFINPTLSIYVSEYTLYIDENIDEKVHSKYYDKLPNNTIEILGNEIVGPFKKYEGLYIDGTWDYGFGDMSNKTEEEILIPENQEYEIKEKLYRFDDFVDMYNREYAEQI